MNTTPESRHIAHVRNEISSIMHNLAFMDLSAHSKEAAQYVIRSQASNRYGPDVARIAADRVIDCLMWL